MSLSRVRRQLRDAVVGTRRALRSRPLATVHGGCSMTVFGEPGFDTFFGYHDVSPFSHDDRLLLASRRPAHAGPAAAGSPLDLGVFDLSAGSPQFQKFASTTAWCWQQGCRLQWYRQPSTALFNITERGRHGATLFDLSAGQERHRLERPLYAVSGDGRHGVSLNFARLQRLRPGYGYDDVADATRAERAPADDGLWLLDLESGKADLVLPLAAAAGFGGDESMAGATHYFNHVLWNPSGTRFFFLHLWQSDRGGRRARALVFDRRSGVSALGPHGHVSHHCWLDDDRVIVYATEPASGPAYYIYDARGRREPRRIGGGGLCEDGHPSMSPAQRGVMITDTYPDDLAEQHVLGVDIPSGRMERVASLYSPTRFRGERRCDLHPRWSRSGRHIAIDSAHLGERRLCTIELETLVERLTSASAAPSCAHS